MDDIDYLTNLNTKRYLYSEEKDKKINIKDFYTLFISIDKFMQINDSYGHDIGDKVIKDIANMLTPFKNEDEYLIRYSGKEYLLLLKKSDYDIEKNANKMRRIIESTKFNYENDIEILITVSIGISLNDYNFIENVKESVVQADVALYDAKCNGRNRVSVYTKELNFKYQ